MGPCLRLAAAARACPRSMFGPRLPVRARLRALGPCDASKIASARSKSGVASAHRSRWTQRSPMLWAPIPTEGCAGPSFDNAISWARLRCSNAPSRSPCSTSRLPRLVSTERSSGLSGPWVCSTIFTVRVRPMQGLPAELQRLCGPSGTALDDRHRTSPPAPRARSDGERGAPAQILAHRPPPESIAPRAGMGVCGLTRLPSRW